MGERRHRHHRHPRLRQRSRRGLRADTIPPTHGCGCSSMSDLVAASSVSVTLPVPTIRSFSRSSAVSQCWRKTRGDTRSPSPRRSWLIVMHSCSGSFPDYRCWRGSVTLSLRTPIRSGTACFTLTAGRSSRSRTSPKPRSASDRPDHGRQRQPADPRGPPDVEHCPDFPACVVTARITDFRT